MKYIFVTVFIVISALFCYYIYTNYHFGVPTEKYNDPQRNDLPIMKHSTVNLVKRLKKFSRSKKFGINTYFRKRLPDVVIMGVKKSGTMTLGEQIMD